MRGDGRSSDERIRELEAALVECAYLYEMVLIANGAKPEFAAMHSKRFRDIAASGEHE